MVELDSSTSRPIRFRLLKRTFAITGLGALMLAPITAVPVAFAAEGDVIVESSFEDGVDGWTAEKGGTLSLSSDAASGANSLSVTGRTATQSGPFADVSGVLELGAVYKLSGKLKYTEGADKQQFNFTFCPSNFNGCADTGKTFNKGQWEPFEHEFTAESKHTQMDWFFIETPWVPNPSDGALQDFLVDDISLVKTKDAPAPVEFDGLEKIQTKPVGDHNPLVGHKFGADPHHLIYKGRLYIYSTNDTQQYEANAKDEKGLPTQSNGYGAITTLNVMSTDDMVNWVDHGNVPIAKQGGAAPWSNNSWAPAAIEKDGKVYLYFCDSGTGTAVVVGGSPLGPWEDPVGKKIIPDMVDPEYKENGGFPQGMWLFDPEIFIDDDGQAYLYFGGNSVIGAPGATQGPQNPKSTRVVKLKDDLVTLDGDPVTIDGPGMFEASSMFKRNGKYYYSYSSNFQVQAEEGKYPVAGAIAYMMSDDPMDFSADKYAGVAFVNQSNFFGAGNGGNNHSDMFNYRGKSYFTYHTQTVGAAWANAVGNPGGTQGYRSVHIDEIEFEEDGTIKPIKGTNAGVEQIQNFNPYRTFEAETLAWQLGVKTAKTDRASVEFPEHNENGNMVLSSLDTDDFSGISQVDFGNGAKSVTAAVKPLVEGTRIEVRLDNEDGQLVSEIEIDTAVGQWSEVTADVTGAAGVHDLFFVFKGPEGSKLMEVDTWKFAGTDAPVETDFAALQALVDEVALLDSAKYTDGTWAVLSSALTAAKAVLGDEGATQSQVDEAADALRDARSGLKEVGTTPVDPIETDFAALQALVDEVALLDSAKYTDGTWAVLSSALTAAKAVLGDEGATQSQVDEAADALRDARSGLKEVGTTPVDPVDPDGPKPKPNDPSDKDKDKVDQKQDEKGDDENLAQTGAPDALTAFAAVLIMLTGGVLLRRRSVRM